MRKNLLLLTLLSCLVLCSPILAGEQEKPKEKQPQKITAPQMTEQSQIEFLRTIFFNDAKKVEELISQGADCNAVVRGYLPLNMAVKYGHIDIVLVLIEHGALPNGKDGNGSTPLSYIIESKPEEWSKYADITQLLLDKGADVNAGNDQGVTPLHCAAAAGRKDIASLFFAHGGDINVKDNNGRTLLQYSVASGSQDIVSLFLAHDADIDEKDYIGRTLLHFAAGASVPYAESHSNPDIVRLLLGKEINIDEIDSQLKKLVSAGSDVNVQDKHGIAPLHIAASAGHSNTVELLVAQEAYLDMKDNAGRTPLHYAAGAALETKQGHKWKPGASSENIEIVELLIEKGADVNVKDTYGLTPLHYATVDHSTNIMALLLSRNAYVDVKDKAGRAPLHYAVGAVYGKNNTDIWTIDMAKLLLDEGASIDVQDNIGWTPLHYATYILSKDIIEYLIQEGADLDVVDKRGYTAYSWNRAQAFYYQELSRFDPTVDWQIYIQEYNETLRLLRKTDSVCFVATNGKDTNPGTLEDPFRTIATAIDIAGPGDIILIRDGIYHCKNTIRLDKSGEQGKPIYIRSYPGETPILDFSGAKGDSILITGAYWRLKGLTITHGFRGAVGLYGDKACHNVLEQIRADDNRYLGIRIEAGAAYNILLNCDSCRNFDHEWNGEDSDGFGACWNIGRGNVLIGNRAWNNSDDGYDFWRANSSLRLERCYAWRNGENIWNYPFFIGNANGFKLGKREGRHILIGCLAWGHSGWGLTLNSNTSGVIIYNCAAWDNDINYSFDSGGSAKERCVFSNNISYDGGESNRISPRADSRSNSWDASLGLILTDDDFVSLDDSQMTAPRNPDGSILENDFLKLSPNSKAIDKGIDVNLPYTGKAPDLGAFEYRPTSKQPYIKMLHQYVRDHDITKIKELLEKGQDVNAKDWLGYAPLHWAIYFGYSDIAEMLISKGASPNLISDTGRTPLEISEAMDDKNLVQLLKKHGAKD